MSFSASAITLATLAVAVSAQQVGTNQAEVHPALPYQKCTASGCTTVNTNVVLDANWRWVHNVGGSTNCYTGNTWDKTLCPDPTTCAKNCALDGANYASTYGVSTSGNALTLDLVTGSNIGSRNYLINGNSYEMFKLKNMEFTFDVDVSQLPCGLNGALYFVNMAADGGVSKYPTNKAGAAYGTGYCDSQCPQDLKFINGLANVAGWTPSTGDSNSGTGSAGSCCPEMDIWEANSISNALTPHPCSVTTQTACNSTESCGVGSDRYDGLCDKDGCDFNPYRWNNHTFYGPGKTVDTNSKFTVVTQFITADGTATGALSGIKRLYVQNGKVIQQSNTDVTGITTTNEITDNFCNQQKTTTGDTNEFEKLGGLTQMGKAFDQGMVLVLSIWDDYAVDMLWLDSVQYPTTSPATAPGVARGTCATTSGNPATVNSQSPNSKVIYSNIKFGTFGSTYKAS